MASRRHKEQDDQEPLVVIETEPLDPGPSLPVWRKLCFAIGGAPYQTTNTVINFFISIFLLEVANISPSYISIILFVGKVWDAITDPTCGYLVHKCNSRFGKFRPWILFSAPFACAAYFCLWFVPDISEVGKFVWYFFCYCSFQMLLSGLHVPFTSMTMALTPSQKERDSVTAYRMVAEAVGVLVAVVIQGQLVSKYRKSGDCGEDKELTDDDLKKEKWSYVLGAIIVISSYMLCAVITFFGTKERLGVTTADPAGFFKGVKDVLTFKPYVILSAAFLFLSLAIAIVQGNLALYCTHSIGLGDHFANFILVLLICAIVVMPFWQKCIVRFGKKSTFAAGMMVFIPCLISELFIPDNVYAYYAVFVVAGFGISVSLLLPWSMLPDVIDEFTLKYGTRKDSIFYSFYVFFNKLSIGVGLGISQAVLALGGYETGECNQPESVGMALRLLVVPGPVLFTLLALLALWAYPIDERRRKAIKAEINEWRKQQSEQPSKEQQREPMPDLLKSSPCISVSYQSIEISSKV